MHIQPSQKRRLHLLLNLTRLMWQKQSLISSFTGGRTEHSSQMTDKEAEALISYLQDQGQDNDKDEINKRMDKMRKKLLSYVYEMRWAAPGDWTTALQKIDEFCTGKHGRFKKPLQKHSYEELVQVVTQFGQIYLDYLRGI